VKIKSFSRGTTGKYCSKYLAVQEKDEEQNKCKSTEKNYQKTGSKQWLYPIIIIGLALVLVGFGALFFHPTITGLTTGEILVFENLTSTNYTFNEATINSTINDIILNQTIIIDPINYSTSIPSLNLTLPIEDNFSINSTNLTLPIIINQSDEEVSTEIVNESAELINLTLPVEIICPVRF